MANAKSATCPVVHERGQKCVLARDHWAKHKDKDGFEWETASGDVEAADANAAQVAITRAAPTEPTGGSGVRKLIWAILAHIAALPELQKVWAALPPAEPISGYKDVQDTWLRLLGHLPTYRLLCKLENLTLDSLPEVVAGVIDDLRGSY